MKGKQFIALEWVDACLLGDDMVTHKEASTQALMHGFAAGVLVSETKDAITLARDFFDADGDGSYRGVGVYPKKLVIKVNRYDIFQPSQPRKGEHE